MVQTTVWVPAITHEPPCSDQGQLRSQLWEVASNGFSRKVTQPTHLEWTFRLCTAQAMSKGVLDPCTSEHRTQG